MNYNELPQQVYLIGSLNDDRIILETEEDVSGKNYILIWDNKNECEKFKGNNIEKIKHKIQLIKRNVLSQILYNINCENEISL